MHMLLDDKPDFPSLPVQKDGKLMVSCVAKMRHIAITTPTRYCYTAAVLILITKVASVTCGLMSLSL